MAHLAYNASDGTPRVTPVWFAWEGGEIIICSIISYTKFKSLQEGARIAIKPNWVGLYNFETRSPSG